MSDTLSRDIRRAAMDLLARREHSVSELQTKLGRRFEDSVELIDIELRRLGEEGLQSDSRFASSYIRARSQRGFGPLRIGHELERRGVRSSDIESALAESDTDWRQLAREVLVKKYGRGAAENYPEKARRARFLQYRGFPSELVMVAQDEHD